MSSFCLPRPPGIRRFHPSLRLDPDPDAALPVYLYPSASASSSAAIRDNWRPDSLIAAVAAACLEGNTDEIKKLCSTIHKKKQQFPQFESELDLTTIQDPRLKVGLVLAVAQRQQQAVLDCLVEAGADLNEAAADGTSILFPLIARGQSGMLQYLLTQHLVHLDLEGVDAHGRTPLLFALRLKQVNAALLLLRYGASIFASNSDSGETVLSLTAGLTDWKMKQQLLELVVKGGGDLNQQFEIQLSTLGTVCATQFAGSFHLNSQPTYQWNPEQRKYEVDPSSSLSSSSATAAWIGLRSQTGFYPSPSLVESYSQMDLAIYHADLPFVEWLLGQGADEMIETPRIQSGLISLAVVFEQRQLLDELMKRGVSLHHAPLLSLLVHCIECNNPNLMSLLLADRYHPNANPTSTASSSTFSSSAFTVSPRHVSLEDGLLTYSALTGRYSLVELFASIGAAYSEASEKWAKEEINRPRQGKTSELKGNAFERSEFRQAMSKGRHRLQRQWQTELKEHLCNDVVFIVLAYADPYSGEKRGEWNECGYRLDWKVVEEEEEDEYMSLASWDLFD